MGKTTIKLCNQKGQDLKGVRQAKKPTKRNPAVSQQDYSNVYGRKKTITKIKTTEIIKKFVDLLIKELLTSLFNFHSEKEHKRKTGSDSKRQFNKLWENEFLFIAKW